MAENDWENQVAMNEQVFAQLTGHGEDLSDGRHVIHYFYDGDVERLSKALSEEGAVPATKVAEAIGKYGIKADKINPLYA